MGFRFQSSMGKKTLFRNNCGRAAKPEKFTVDRISLHCDPEVSCNFIALTVLSFDMILRHGEELEFLDFD